MFVCIHVFIFTEAELGSHVNNLLSQQNKLHKHQLIAETVLRECCVGWEMCEFGYVNMFVCVCVCVCIQPHLHGQTMRMALNLTSGLFSCSSPPSHP